jgi:heme A synthase
MPQRFSQLAWTAAISTYLLIILGAIVRITGSGMGCGEHWPLCRGQLLPPFDVPTLIEYAHRLSAAVVSVLVVGLAAYAWWLRDAPEETTQRAGPASGTGSPPALASSALVRARRAAYLALGLLVVQVLLGAVTVKLDLPAWTVILHLGTAMLLLAALLTAARTPASAPRPAAYGALALGFVTVLFGGLTANLGAASACLGFPLCNHQLMPQGGYLQHIHWTHRLLAYSLFAYTVWWAGRTRERSALGVLALLSAQVVVAAAMIELALPPPLQAAHVALGAGVWAGLVLAAF